MSEFKWKLQTHYRNKQNREHFSLISRTHRLFDYLLLKQFIPIDLNIFQFMLHQHFSCFTKAFYNRFAQNNTVMISIYSFNQSKYVLYIFSAVVHRPIHYPNLHTNNRRNKQSMCIWIITILIVVILSISNEFNWTLHRNMQCAMRCDAMRSSKIKCQPASICVLFAAIFVSSF